MNFNLSDPLSCVAMGVCSCVDLERQRIKTLLRSGKTNAAANWTRRVRTVVANESTEILGTFRGRTYYLTIRVSPSLNRVKDFAAVLYYSPENDPERKIQIARIDTTHGYTHFDRLYRRDQPKERIDVDVWEAAALLEANWQTFAESFDDLARE